MVEQNVNTASDEQLLAAHRAKQHDCFELLVRRHGQELFHFLYRLLGSAATAEDIVQEAFLQVHLSADRFDSGRRFRPWLFTIAANKARDYLRSQRRRPELYLDALPADDGAVAEMLHGAGGAPSLTMEVEERSTRVRRMIEQLPAALREVIVLGYYHGFAYREMAEILDVPIGTIKSRLHTAVARIGRLHEAWSEAELADGRQAARAMDEDELA